MAKMRLNADVVKRVRSHWKGDTSFLGFPDAEADATANPDAWLTHLLVKPNWFKPAMQKQSAIIVGRKGVGKSASRIAAERESGADKSSKDLIVYASADELAARYALRIKGTTEKGVGAVTEWCRVFAEIYLERIASMVGTQVPQDWEQSLQAISERDFGKRLGAAVRDLCANVKRVRLTSAKEMLARVTGATSFVLYVDDFDKIQEEPSLVSLRIIRDAIEAADRITHQNKNTSIHLLMRQDLWLRVKPGWHYADKVAGLVQLNWSQDDLRKWADRRLRQAVAIATGVNPRNLEAGFGDYWNIFFPDRIHLRNNEDSEGIHYLVRRTMYTPRSLRKFMELILKKATALLAGQRNVEDAEEEFSAEQLGFLETEFSSLCTGLGICL